jgi:hypothetical protein
MKSGFQIKGALPHVEASGLANVCIDVLADDEMDLPEKLPAKETYLG